MTEVDPFMSREDAAKVRPGDDVRVRDLWNRSTRTQRLAVPTKVNRVYPKMNSQTGIIFVVRTVSGSEIELDAGWFQP